MWCVISSECGVWSASTLFALTLGISIIHIHNKNYKPDTLFLEIDRLLVGAHLALISGLKEIICSQRKHFEDSRNTAKTVFINT